MYTEWRISLKHVAGSCKHAPKIDLTSRQVACGGDSGLASATPANHHGRYQTQREGSRRGYHPLVQARLLLSPRSVFTDTECQERLAVDIDAATPTVLRVNEREQWLLPGVDEVAAFLEPPLNRRTRTVDQPRRRLDRNVHRLHAAKYTPPRRNRQRTGTRRESCSRQGDASAADNAKLRPVLSSRTATTRSGHRGSATLSSGISLRLPMMVT